MKISVIISTMLIAQVSASFFDMFQGAVLSVQNSVGKLISDVAIDVRDTVDCTILAVETVLSLSDDATARYNDKCGGGKNNTDSEKNGHKDVGVSKVEVSVDISNNDEYFRKKIPAEIDARINETLKKVLSSYNPHKNILSVQNVLAKESKQLSDVSSLVKQELEKLTNEVNSDFKNVKQKESEPSVETILQEIRLLENRERGTKNNSEASEIHKVIDEVLDKLDVIEATEATENLKLEEILKDLEKNSDSSFVSLKQQFGEWKKEESRNLDEIKNKMEEHEKNAKHSKHFHDRKSNITEPVDLMNKTHNVDIISSKMDEISLLNNETVQQASKNNGSNDFPFIEIPTSTQLTSSLSHITSTNNEKDRSGHFLNTPDMEMVVNPTTSTTAYENERSTIFTSIAPIILNDNVLSDVVISPSSITENTSESILANKNEESSTLSTNEHDSNKKFITNIPLLITETTAYSGINRTIESTTDSEEKKLPILTRNKPKDSPNTVNESITEIPVENEVQLPLTTQNSLNDDKLSNSVITSTTFTVVENTPLSMTDNPVEYAKFSENEESSTSTTEKFTSVDSNDTVITSSQIMASATVSETIQSIESTTGIGYKQPSVSTSNPNTTFPNIANDDNSNDTTVTSASSPIEVSIAISETSKPFETTVVSGNETPSILTTTNLNVSNDDDLNETLIVRTSFPFKVGIAVSDTTQPIETTTVSGIEERLTIFTNNPPTTLNISNEVDSNDTMITSTSSPLKVGIAISETSKPIETIAVSGNETPSILTTTNLNILNDDDLNETLITSTSFPFKVGIAISDTTQPIETTTVSGIEELLTIFTNNPPTTLNISNKVDSNDTMITSTSSPLKVGIAINETSKPIETIAVSGNETSSILTTTNLNILNDDDLNETLITSTSFPFKVGIAISDTTQPIETTTVSGIEELLTIFTNNPPTTLNISNEDDSNDTMIMSTSSPIKVTIAVTETTQPIETTTVSGNVDSILIINTTTIASDDIPNDTIIMSTLYPIRSSNTITRTTQPVEISTISGNEEPSTLTKYKFTTTPNIAIDNDSNDTMVMNTPSPITINIAVIETTQPIEIATVSSNEDSSTMNKPTTPPITANDDSSNGIETMNASTSIVENVTDNKIEKQEQVTIRAESVESSNSDENGSFIIGTSFPTTKSTPVSEVIQPTESTPTTKNEFASVMNKVNENYLNITVTNTTFSITDSTLVITSDQQVETTTASQNQESSTLNSIQSTINPESPQISLHEHRKHDTLVADTLSTTTDTIPVKKYNPSETPSSLEKEENLVLNTEQTIVSPNVLNYSLPTIASNVITESSHDPENMVMVNSPTTPSGRDLTTLVTAQVTTTPKLVNDQDLKSPQFIITESPIVNENIPVFNKPIIPVDRKWLTPSRRKNTSNIFNQQSYNTNAAPINENYSIRDRIPRTGTPLIPKGVSDESQTIPIYGKSAIPNLYNQQPSPSNQEQLKYPDVRESIEYIRKRILETGTPYTISRYISTTPVNVQASTAAPTFPAIRDIYTPRRPLYPENPNYMETPRNLIRPRYSYNRPLANTNGIPMGLTTYKPLTTASRTGNNYRNAPLDYDSFFHIPQKNSEAHQRALREARQLIENSKKSEQIINNILKNKNNIGRRSIFNNPRTLNAGK